MVEKVEWLLEVDASETEEDADEAALSLSSSPEQSMTVMVAFRVGRPACRRHYQWCSGKSPPSRKVLSDQSPSQGLLIPAQVVPDSSIVPGEGTVPGECWLREELLESLIDQPLPLGEPGPLQLRRCRRRQDLVDLRVTTIGRGNVGKGNIVAALVDNNNSASNGLGSSGGHQGGSSVNREFFILMTSKPCCFQATVEKPRFS